MAKGKALELTIRIAGKMDKSLTAAINQSQSKISNFSRTISNIGTVGLATMGALTVATAGALAKCTNEAVKYENELANVIKYVDGLADANGRIGKAAVGLDGQLLKAENGKTYAENYDLVYDSIQRLSTQVPLTRDYLADMVAALGQSGKTIDDIFKFDKTGKLVGGLAQDAAVMAAAWDIEAKEAADYSAKWQNSFHMSHEEIMTLANQINYLGAHSATTAAEIANAVNQAASLGQLGGISPETTAALADAMLATGVASDRVGTSIKRMALNLSKGSDMTKKQQAVLAELGYTAEEITKAMSVNGTETLSKLFEGIGNLPKERQLNAVGQLFGIWAAEGGAKIVGNLDVYQKALDMVKDSTLWGATDANGNAQLTSMEREFDIKTQAPEAVRQMRDSAFQMLQTDIGRAFVPLTNTVNNSLKNLFLELTDNMPQLEEIAGKLADLASKGLDTLSESIEKALPYISQFLDYLNEHGDDAVKKVGMLAGAFTAMKFAPVIEGTLGLGADLLLGPQGMYGGRSGGLLNAVGTAKELLFGKQTKTRGTIGGFIPGLFDSAKGFMGNTKDYGKGVFSAFKNLGNAPIVSNPWVTKLMGGLSKTGGVAGEIMSGIYEGTIKDLVDGGAMLGGMALDGIKAMPGNIWNSMGVRDIRRGITQKTFQTFGVTPKEIFGGISGAVGNVGGGLFNFGKGALGFGKDALGTMMPLMNALGSVQSPFLGILGSFASGAGPIILAISGIIAVVSILGDHLEDIRTLIGNVFGEQGLTVFDAFMDKVSAVGQFIQGLFADGGVAKALEPVQQAITGMFGENAGAAFSGLTTILQSIMGVIQQIVDFSINQVKPIILDIFNFITGTVVPILLQTFTAAAPIIAQIITNVGSIIMGVFNLVASAIRACEPVFAAIATALLNLGSVVIPAVLESFSAWSGTILQVVGDVQAIFNDLVAFVTDVFAGNWGAAWEDVVKLFGDAIQGIVDLAKAPINAVIGLINGLFDQINALPIPEWAAEKFGVSKISLPHFNYLAKGGFTSGPSIAGEAGMEAVISFQQSQRRQNLAIWQRAGELLGARHELMDIGDAGSRSGSNGGSFVYSPQIVIQGNADETVIERLLREQEARFRQQFEAMMKENRRLSF